ncbi:glucan endo-1,3-beta-glucosidase 4 [Spinacia oleracea]|uniref:Glucan endo-1,3-beta-glucosidase 4 n=1 Tax=Spinacia oleracea TaxID=3562 RepID=A0ABM3QW83_SPIOL|nr:glucan endo-1,3-beta-glucosidase 4-like [Spinacia oleracea]
MSNALPFILFASLLVIFSGQITDGRCAYCVSNPKASRELIQKKLDFCCGDIPESCDLIQPGEPCYVDGDVRATASYVFNDWYVGGSECNFEGAEIMVYQDPSHGDCKFKCR